MNYTGTITLSDNSRLNPLTGFSGYLFDVTAPDQNFSIALDIADSKIIAGDSPFFQGQILGPGDMPLVLQDWTYFGGQPFDATTFVGGTWMFRWFDPVYLTYSVWYKDYDTSQFSLVGNKFRNSIIEQNVGNFYASMVVPQTPGHYQTRWLYLKDYSGSYAHEIVNKFVSVSRGIDPMPDYTSYVNGSISLPSFAPISEAAVFGTDPGFTSRGIVDGIM